jgi:hypothetical protein
MRTTSTQQGTDPKVLSPLIRGDIHGLSIVLGEPPSPLSSLIDRASRCSKRYGDEYSEHLYSLLRFPEDYEATLTAMGQALEGRVLLDLGGGRRPRLMELAERFGVSLYLDVDLYYHDDARTDPASANWLPEHGPGSKLPAAVVACDMLDFLWRVPDGSCNVTVSGIDGLVIPLREYASEMARQFDRVVPPGGVAFGAYGDPLYELRHYERWESLQTDRDWMHVLRRKDMLG